MQETPEKRIFVDTMIVAWRASVIIAGFGVFFAFGRADHRIEAIETWRDATDAAAVGRDGRIRVLEAQATGVQRDLEAIRGSLTRIEQALSKEAREQ
ncbi:MAG TPA: hypothetical protein PKA33_01785 [Amaricoccus sp.]|uniref:hypothetical protein n=1 Tax=Amaricoccus sp. TaxID=1872485 RepID=UPI002C3BEFC8|nr:hypothetical protein [Amaricoccus sp.]HMR51174.1 hypothetical protein [Amaricoccus sp.]HMT98078.1 hypothetical protein [Amaricoccus sp.]